MVYILLAAFLLVLGLLGMWILFQRRTLETKKDLEQAFKSLSFEILEKNSRVFLDLAKTSLEKYHESSKQDLDAKQKAMNETLKPFQETLKALDTQQRELEKRREGAYAVLSKQLEEMKASDRELQKETAKLSQALRSPQIRGSWGGGDSLEARCGNCGSFESLRFF